MSLILMNSFNIGGGLVVISSNVSGDLVIVSGIQVEHIQSVIVVGDCSWWSMIVVSVIGAVTVDQLIGRWLKSVITDYNHRLQSPITDYNHRSPTEVIAGKGQHLWVIASSACALKINDLPNKNHYYPTFYPITLKHSGYVLVAI